MTSSNDIRVEVEDVLSRPELRLKFKTLTDERAKEMLARLDEGNFVVPAPIPRTSRDPKDDMFLAAAAEAKADYLVTEDNDLLTLKTFGSTRIVNALDFLQILTAPPPDNA